MSIKTKILGIGRFIPENCWKNSDLEKVLDTSDEWIQQRTGIKQRYWINENDDCGASGLGVKAAEKALENAGVKKEEIDMIFFATLSPDHEFPGTACFFQGKMDMPGIPAIDVRQQCAGFLYGISIADNFIKNGMAKKVLVVGAEVHSRGLDLNSRSRSVSVLFGDGAGAMVLGQADEKDPHILSTHLHSDGKYAKELCRDAKAYVAFKFSGREAVLGKLRKETLEIISAFRCLDLDQAYELILAYFHKLMIDAAARKVNKELYGAHLYVMATLKSSFSMPLYS